MSFERCKICGGYSQTDYRTTHTITDCRDSVTFTFKPIKIKKKRKGKNERD